MVTYLDLPLIVCLSHHWVLRKLLIAKFSDHTQLLSMRYYQKL